MGKKVTHLFFFFFQFRTFGERSKKCIYLLELEKALLSKEFFYFNICNGFSEILNIFVRTLQLNFISYLKCTMYLGKNHHYFTQKIGLDLHRKKGSIWYWQKKALQYYITERELLEKCLKKGKIRSTILCNLI